MSGFGGEQLGNCREFDEERLKAFAPACAVERSEVVLKALVIDRRGSGDGQHLAFVGEKGGAGALVVGAFEAEEGAGEAAELLFIGEIEGRSGGGG